MYIDTAMVYAVGITACALIIIAFVLYGKAVKRANESGNKYSKLMYLKKSSETRMGLVGEQLAPYLEEWPFSDPRQFRLISSPVDGVNFGEDEITIVEIKTGKSRLSKNQKRIREQVRQGKIAYVEFRVGENGCKVKRTAHKK